MKPAVVTGRVAQLASSSPAVRIPRYRQIADHILRDIESGCWKPGDRLPSEIELAEATSASLGTVQKALRELADQGVVVRRHGHGTFVVGTRTPEQDLLHMRFLREGGVALLPVYMRVITIQLTDDRGPWAHFLGAEEVYVHLCRMMNINNEFEVYSELYLAGSRFESLAGMGPQELDGCSIRELLKNKFNAPTLRVEQTMRCGVLPPRVRVALDIAQGSYGLIWEIRGRSYRDAPITFQRFYVPPTDRPLEILPRVSLGPR